MAFGRGRQGSKLYPETLVQRSIVRYLKFQYPFVKKYIVKITNEAKREAYQHALQKSLGMNPGASDLIILWPTMDYYGLILEVKPDGFKFVPSNKAHTDRQQLFIDNMNAKGYFASFVIGFDHAKDVIDTYFKKK